MHSFQRHTNMAANFTFNPQRLVLTSLVPLGFIRKSLCTKIFFTGKPRLAIYSTLASLVLETVAKPARQFGHAMQILNYYWYYNYTLLASPLTLAGKCYRVTCKINAQDQNYIQTQKIDIRFSLKRIIRLALSCRTKRPERGILL